MNNKKLEINNLNVFANDVEILKGINLDIKSGEIHVIMGPNGNGKSTLASTIMGDPKYRVTEGKLLYNNKDLLSMKVDERARAGIFLAMQYPSELSGVNNLQLLKTAINARREDNDQIKLFDFYKDVEKVSKELKVKDNYAERFVNVGFSGGEKKKNEIFQMLLLKPKLIILDEIDSGLDIDSVKLIGESIMNYYNQFKEDVSIIIITHYPRILEYIKTDYVHIMKDGKIIKTGDASLAFHIEEVGYSND